MNKNKRIKRRKSNSEIEKQANIMGIILLFALVLPSLVVVLQRI